MADFDFKRKAYGQMLDWKQTKASKSALLVEGARRVGKTHLIRRFAKAEYESCLFIDFSERGRQIQAIKRAFEESDDVPSLLERLQILSEVRLTPERSCVVFDEVDAEASGWRFGFLLRKERK